MIIKITEQDVQDFISCPIYFNFKRKNPKIKIDKTVTMSRLLNQVAGSFCAKLMDGEVMPLYDIKRKWDMLCKRYPDYIDNKKSREGISLLYTFFNWARERQLRVVAYGQQYMIPFKVGKSDQIEFYGTTGIICVNEKHQLENLILSFSNRPPDFFLLDTNLKTTFDHIGFKESFKMDLLGTLVHHVKTNKDYYTTRDVESQKKRAGKIITNVVTCIQNNIWYPKESPYCVNCQLKDFCRMYGTEE